jgi:hypothetical protein
MYADSNIVHEPVTDCPERISGLEALLKQAPPLPECKLLWHCALEKLLDGTQNGSNPNDGRLRSETKTSSRTTRSSGSTGETEKSNASHGNIHR